MGFEKVLLDESAHHLMKKADDCFALAKNQHDIAEKQHEIAARQHKNADQLDTSADQLNALGQSLEAKAVEINGGADAASARTGPRLREGSKRLPRAGGPAAPPANSK